MQSGSGAHSLQCPLILALLRWGTERAIFINYMYHDGMVKMNNQSQLSK